MTQADRSADSIYSPQRVHLLQPQTECPPEHVEFARAFISACPFTVAVTVPANPHEYCLREWVPDTHQADYDRFIQLAAARGYNGRFLSTTYRYLNVDGFRYWESPKIDRTGMIINRARADLGPDEGVGVVNRALAEDPPPTQLRLEVE